MRGPPHIAIMAHIATTIGRRAIVIAALECGYSRPEAAARAGISARTMNRYLSPKWSSGA